MRQDIGFDSIQEIDLQQVFKGCSVYCETILTPEQARRKTVAACQAALTKRGVAVLVVPADVANAAAHDERPYAVHVRPPLICPSDVDLDSIAALLNRSSAVTIYAGAGCEGAHDEVVASAARLQAPMAHTSRGKDFVEYDNPYNVGMTGMIGGAAGYHAIFRSRRRTVTVAPSMGRRSEPTPCAKPSRARVVHHAAAPVGGSNAVFRKIPRR